MASYRREQIKARHYIGLKYMQENYFKSSVDNLLTLLKRSKNMTIQNGWNMTRNTMAAIENSAILTICELVLPGMGRRRLPLKELFDIMNALRRENVHI